MTRCSNCSSAVLGHEVLRVHHGDQLVTALCRACVGPAAKPRITLTRNSATDTFEYEQYTCVRPLSAPDNGF